MWLAFACSVPAPPSEPLEIGGFAHPFQTDTNFGACGCGNYVCGIRHLGTDLPGPVGTPIAAVGDGIVVYRSTSPDWGEGNVALFVRHTTEEGPFVALYGHLLSDREVGDEVRAGDAIGLIGPYHIVLPDGLVRGVPHLHFGIHPGGDMPSGAAGQIADPECDHPEATSGFVAPLAFLRSHRPPR
jgi:murein DD-endopeptidase MepM/ murein hydrolase activator NlpD